MTSGPDGAPPSITPSRKTKPERIDTMSLIGVFSSTEDGFTGRLQTLLLDIEATLSPPKDASRDNAPDYWITLGKDSDGARIGSARNRKTDEGRAFVSFVIDDPSLPAPIYAVLFPADASNRTHRLYWTRASRREEKA
jgi:uncharacterized protein (DUF736 family)